MIAGEANAERQQLEQELADLQNDLADYQADYAYDAQVDALDKEADKFEETKDNEIAKVEASVDTEERFTEPLLTVSMRTGSAIPGSDCLEQTVW